MQPVSWKKNTAVFMTSQAISLFGSALVQYAITWYITLTTKSGAYMTISIVCALLPTLFLSPFAGVWADRYDRKKLIMFSDGAIALSTLLLAIIFLMGYKSIWLLFAVSSIRARGGAVQSPAIGAMLPDIVPGEHLTRVNGINGSVQSLLQLASPALAGALLTLCPIEYIFFIDVVTAAAAIAVMLRFLRVPEKERPAEAHAGYLSEMKQGIAYIGRHGYLVRLFTFSVVIYLAVAPIAFLTPLQVVRSYGEEVWRLTGIEMAFSIGMLVGGLSISAWGGLKNKNRTLVVAVSLVFMGLFTALMGAGVPFWPYLAFMALVGLGLPFFNTPATVMLQERVDPAYLGRVFSVMTMINSSIMPLGMVIFGPLADRVSVELLLVITGAMMLATGCVLLFDRTMRAAGVPAQIAAAEGGTGEA